MIRAPAKNPDVPGYRLSYHEARIQHTNSRTCTYRCPKLISLCEHNDLVSVWFVKVRATVGTVAWLSVYLEMTVQCPLCISVDLADVLK